MFSTESFLSFLNQSPTAYHAVSELSEILKKNDYIQFEEFDKWPVSSKKIALTRADSSLIAFSLPKNKIKKIKIICAHTDSPHIKLKVNSIIEKKSYHVWGAEIYGGVLLHTYLDRDLRLAGKIFYTNEKNEIKNKLVYSDKALCKIPNLAIHLNRDVNINGFKVNSNDHLNPIFSSIEFNTSELWELFNLKEEQIVEYDLQLIDAQNASLIGLNQEFLSASRLDNQVMAYLAALALSESAESDSELNCVALFNHEEVGSKSHSGADSNFLKDVLDRLFYNLNYDFETVQQIKANSLIVSADMAHAMHPNYAEKHDENFMPIINHGPVIKINNNQRYSSNAESIAYIKQLCIKQNIPFQMYYHRQDLACGSTVGPFISSTLGINAIDLGNPMLAMHSIRETAGTRDLVTG
jgi:aspartyl aminopeptidase